MADRMHTHGCWPQLTLSRRCSLVRRVIQHYQALQDATRPWCTPRVYPFEFWHLAPLRSWEQMLGRGPPEPGFPYPAGFVPLLGFEPDSDEDGPLYI